MRRTSLPQLAGKANPQTSHDLAADLVLRCDTSSCPDGVDHVQRVPKTSTTSYAITNDVRTLSARRSLDRL